MYRVKGLILFVAVLALGLIPASAHANPYNVSVSLSVNDTILRVAGKTFPGAFVTIKDGGAVVGTVTANSSGDFTKNFTSQNPGIHNLQIYALDTTNNTMTDTVSQSVSLQNQTLTTVSFFLPSTLEIGNKVIQKGLDVMVMGKTIPGGNVTIRLDDQSNYTAAANASGSWTLALNTSGLASGNHSLFAVANDTNGNYSSPTTSREFAVTAVGVPIVSSPGAEKPDGSNDPNEQTDEEFGETVRPQEQTELNWGVVLPKIGVVGLLTGLLSLFALDKLFLGSKILTAILGKLHF